MGYAEKRGSYWRARYKITSGRYGTVKDATGAVMRFRTKREAEQAANDEESKVRAGKWRDPSTGSVTFGEYVNRWYAAQDLAASTLQNYKHHVEEHLLPAFENDAMGDIKTSDVDTWAKRERATGYAESSVRTWRATLHLIFEDAREEGLCETNPAARRRGRGKRAGRSRNRAPEKTVTTALGILLIAERAALLSGRDDEFVAIVTMGYTGMRWGEVVGLETQYVRPGSIRVEWQLYELDTGELYRCPPKDDSYRTIDTPEWHSKLLAEHIARTQSEPCTCHELTYAFRGNRTAKAVEREIGPKLADVARRAGVSSATASAVYNHPEVVAEAARAKVHTAAGDLGYVPGGWHGEQAAHWRRHGFASWLFQPAVTGWYPRKMREQLRPVPVLGHPWPGVPVRGRNSAGRADSCWLPIASGLTPHGLRHTHKTTMVGLPTPPPLMDERMGHQDGSIQARYSHVTPEMRRGLMERLTELWRASLDARRSMSPGSPVATLDRLLREDQGSA